jgi:hypothetical protein
VAGAFAHGHSRLRAVVRPSHRSVNCGGVWRVEDTASPHHGLGESLLVDRDPAHCVDRRHSGRETLAPTVAVGQPLKDVALVPRSRPLALRRRVALGINAPA